MFSPDCYKNQNISNKAVDTHPSVIRLVPECYKTHEMSDKAVDTCIFFFFCI